MFIYKYVGKKIRSEDLKIIFIKLVFNNQGMGQD